MTTTTYYNLNIVEGTDIVNPLIVDNPNYEKIDVAMHNNAVAGVTLATEIANATVHAITRENSDCAVIRFIATSQWKAGDTATVDGVPVTAVLPSGETLPDGAYVINANVLCVLTGTNLTVYVGKSATDANEIAYNGTTVEQALNSLDNSLVSVNTSLEEVNSNLNCFIGQKITIERTVSAGQWANKSVGTIPTKDGYSFIGCYVCSGTSVGISVSYENDSNEVWIYGNTSGTAIVYCYPIYVKNI